MTLAPNVDAHEGPKPGDLFADKYRIKRVLGKGGMGVVLAAEDELVLREVAIKVLLPSIAENAGSTSRFINEGRAAARIRNAHVAEVLDVGKVGGLPYITMEYLEGEDLHDILQREGRLSIPRAVDHVLQAAEGIAYAHALGIVHRDLKPANLFVARRKGKPDITKVLDFGISKMESMSETRDACLTTSGMLIGSPPYMSPEQIMMPTDVGPPADIWSLGTVLYELLTGETPFESAGTDVASIFRAIITVDPVPASERRPEVPKELDAIILRCLEKCKEDRYPHIGELATALAPFGTGPWRGCARRAHTKIVHRVSFSPSMDPPIVPFADEATLSALVASVEVRPPTGTEITRMEVALPDLGKLVQNAKRPHREEEISSVTGVTQAATPKSVKRWSWGSIRNDVKLGALALVSVLIGSNAAELFGDSDAKSTPAVVIGGATQPRLDPSPHDLRAPMLPFVAPKALASAEGPTTSSGSAATSEPTSLHSAAPVVSASPGARSNKGSRRAPSPPPSQLLRSRK